MITVDHHREGIYTPLNWDCQCLRALSNTVDKIRVDRVNCPVDICMLLRGLRNFLACLVSKGLRVMVVESYELYTECVARLFVRVAYVGSLLIERGIHCV